MSKPSIVFAHGIIRTFGRVSGPIVLVGHSYGGTVITHAGTDPRIAALVYIAALALDETETPQGQQDKFLQTDVFKNIDVADGRVWMKPSSRRMEHSMLTFRGPRIYPRRQWSFFRNCSALTPTSERPAMSWQPKDLSLWRRTYPGGKRPASIST